MPRAFARERLLEKESRVQHHDTSFANRALVASINASSANAGEPHAVRRRVLVMDTSAPPWATIAAGTSARFSHPVVSRADWSLVQLPVLAIRGVRPGKTLLVTAGVHGDE